MKTVSRKASIGGLSILAIMLMAAPLISATFAWTATPGTPFTCVASAWSSKCVSDPTFAVGTSVPDTAHIAFNDEGPYGSVVFAVASGTCGNVISVLSNVTIGIPSTPTIAYANVTTTFSTTALSAGNYVWLVHYTGNPDGYKRYPTTGNDCEPFKLTSLPPPTSVPEFPFGMALLMAMAIPALVLFKRKLSLSSLQAL